MVREDYIMRLVTQFAQIVAHILGLRRSGQYPLALIAIDQTLRELLGIGSDSLSRLSDSELLAVVKFTGPAPAWRDKGALLAALLQEEGTIYDLQQQPDLRDQRYLQALQVLLEVTLAAATEPLPAYAPTVEELVDLLEGLHLPLKTGVALLHYYEQVGAYSKAEDVLFELLDAEAFGVDVSRLGIAFYARLAERSDAELVAGNLPRAELAAGLAELRARQDGSR